MKTLVQKLLKNWQIYILLFVSLTVFIVGIKINLFRYDNFDLGKFDLGNMTQMVWNTLHGRVLYLTDYFGTNLPRWSMSHVDPILLLMVPLFAVFQSPLTLVFTQLLLVTFSSVLVYKIAEQEFKNKTAALGIGLAYLFYPAMGFLLAWTAFHGVTLVIPFFLAAFYIFEKMYKEENFSKKRTTWFWVFVVLTMMGKEELPLFILVWSVFIFFFRKNEITSKLSKKLFVVSSLWFVVAFFVIIPAYSNIRVEGYQRFANELQINQTLANDVARPNYFLSRYEEFGGSYSGLIKTILFRPSDFVRVLFNGDKVENMQMTFGPLLYTPFLYPPLFIIALPELLINYSITGGGIGTSEIFNHRISMIIPVLFLAAIYGISYLSKLISSTTKAKASTFAILFSAILVISNVKASRQYNNPIFLWFIQSVQKRVTFLAHARSIFDEDLEIINRDLEVGERFRVAKFERRDRECANDIVSFIPDGASVSGPDYMGSHLSMRETYAIFPALYSSADYVIVDVFALKVVELLGLEQELINDVVGRILKHPNYSLNIACGNLFVFEKVGPHGKSELLPIQESFTFAEKTNLEIWKELFLVDFSFPETAKTGEKFDMNFTYTKRGKESLDDFFLYTTFVNAESGKIYQLPNLPSFAITQINDWPKNRYFTETNEVKFPNFVEAGEYKTFLGISNNTRRRSIYIGNIIVQ